MFTWLVLCLSCLFVPVEGAAVKPEDLAAWLTLTPPKKDSEAWYAANYSRYEWQVALKQGRPAAHLRDIHKPPFSMLPPALQRAYKAHGKSDRLERGEICSCKVKDG